jgi:hypothetical protein
VDNERCVEPEVANFVLEQHETHREDAAYVGNPLCVPQDNFDIWGDDERNQKSESSTSFYINADWEYVRTAPGRVALLEGAS